MKVRLLLMMLAGSSILAFGLYNIHSISHVTEGGVLGFALLLKHSFGVSPAVSTFVMNSLCYFLGYKILGKDFIFSSLASAVFFSVMYRVCELFPPIFPDIYCYPLIAAIAGALFVGVGVGLCVRAGGAPSGDDALAMSLSVKFHCSIEVVYIITDLVVLALSLTYIPFSRLIYSLVTVILSGQIIGIIQRYKA